jgi:hypothetical protein
VGRQVRVGSQPSSRGKFSISGDSGTYDCASSQKTFVVGFTKPVSSRVPAVTTILGEPSTSTTTGEPQSGQNRRGRGRFEVPPGRV